MNRDNKRAPDVDDEDLDSESHAADEPTAVWDEGALRAAGLADLLHKRESEPAPPPATAPTPATRTESSIVVDPSTLAPPSAGNPGPRVATPLPQRPPSKTPSEGLGWGATLALAVVIAGVVYALIRFAKG